MPLKPEFSADSLNYEMKMCFWEEGRLNGLFYLKPVWRWEEGGALDASTHILWLESHSSAAVKASLRWPSLFQGWRMTRCNWPSSVQAAQKKSSPWPLLGSHSRSTLLSWFQFRTVSHNHSHTGKGGGVALSVINLNLSTSQIVPLHIQRTHMLLKMCEYRFREHDKCTRASSCCVWGGLSPS